MVLLENNGDKMAAPVHSGSVAVRRCHVAIADVTHEPEGGLVVVTSDGLLASAIHCHRVALLVGADGGVSVNSLAMPSFHPQVLSTNEFSSS